MTALPRDTHIGAVHLVVADLERQVDFYTRTFGLRLAAAGEGSASLVAEEGGRALLVLDEVPGAPPPPAHATGLFHMAFLLPGRADLAAALLGLGERGWRFDGFADHAVSEALYLTDPEGNGIELYADRPREQWRRVGDGLHITTEPLDLPGLAAEAPGPSERLPPGTVVGHVHLRVSSLDEAESFYVGRLGFDVTAASYPGALFVSAGGYHHHLGLNVWRSRGGSPPPDGSRGLRAFEVVVPERRARVDLLDGADEGALAGPDREVVRVVAG